jgi:hypothetical protein
VLLLPTAGASLRGVSRVRVPIADCAVNLFGIARGHFLSSGRPQHGPMVV